jgi:raffinose/stachyose/melibiose transport system permease protein
MTTKRSSYSYSSGYGVYLIPGVILFLFLIIAPFVANIFFSFTRWTGVGTPTWIGLANYVKASTDGQFWTSFANNLALILVLTTIPTILGLVLAVLLSDLIARRFGNTVASILRAGFYLPQIIPILVSALVWRWILQPDWGMLNSLLNSVGLSFAAHNWLGDSDTALPAIMVMLIWFQIGYPLVIFMAALQRIDPELYEAAEIDGAGWLAKFWGLTVPLIRAEIFVVVLTTTIYALKVFAPIFAMTRGGPGTSTYVASWFSYKNFFENANVGYGSTMATILTLLILVITVIWVRVQSGNERQDLSL